MTPRERAEGAALSRARLTGRAVIVPSLTTPTVEVTAHPNGALSETSNVFPVRVKVHGAWRAINPRLRRTASGSWTTTAASVPVTFSAGGSGPLVTVTNSAGQTVAMYWPAALPAPVVSGRAALYKSVLPGVDLRMEATGFGYQEALVVRDAAAAANPRLRSITYRLKAGRGLVFRRGPGESLGVIDRASGKLIFVVGQPQMWDSSHNRPIPQRASADGAGSGRVTPVPVSYRLAGPAAATIAMTPPAAALTGPRVRYPVFIDPEISPNTSYYVQMMQVSNGYTQKWNTTTGTTSQGSGRTEIGDCGYPNCQWDTPSGTVTGFLDRDYFRFDTPDLNQAADGTIANVYYVSFDIHEISNSDGCTSQPSVLYRSGGIDSSTSWGGPRLGTSWIAKESSNDGGGSSCPAGTVQFDSDDSNDTGMLSYLQNDANQSWPNVTFELQADNESTELEYKLYRNDPSLEVYFNFTPQTPALSSMSVEGQVTCTSTTYTSFTQPYLVATGTENNPTNFRLPIKLNPTLETMSGTAAGGTLSHPEGASNSSQHMSLGSALTGGTSYQFRVTATNDPGTEKVDTVTVPALTSGASPWYPFTVLTGPTAAPAISSFDYPKGQWGQPAGAPGVFTVGTNGQSNIAGFAYSFNGGTASEPVPDAGTCDYLADGGLGTSANPNGGGNPTGDLALVQGTTAQIQVPSNLPVGQNTLYVKSFDQAHNASGETAYTFYVAPNYQTVSQPVQFFNGTSLIAGKSGANANLISQQNNCCNEIWRGGSQLLFNATALNQTFTVTINATQPGWYQIGADMTKSFDYGQVRIDLDQATSDINLGGTASVPYDGYSATVSLHYLDLGTQDLTAGNHTLTFTITGQTTGSSGFKTGINYITLSPTSRYEGESLPHSAPTAGTVVPQYLNGRPWSDNGQLMLQNSTLGAQFTVNFNAPVESDYALGVNLTTGPSYGSLQFNLDPSSTNTLLNAANGPADTYSSSVSATYVFLGGVHLTAGQHVLQVTVTGTDLSSTGDRFDAGLDYLEVVPVTGATDTSFTSAMDNLGIATDNATSFNGGFDLTSGAKNLSLQAMQAAGITPGSGTSAGATFTMNGATFTMPELNTNSTGAVIGDNVIPDGQTIPLPAVKATDVALLAATTCGGTTGSPAMNATLRYSGSTTVSQAAVTSVPDWTTNDGTAQVVLGHWDGGTIPDTSTHPSLYEVVLPADPNLTLASITLPVMPVNFLNDTGCNTASHVLHILAIGTRPASAGQGPSNSVWTGGYAGPIDTAVTPPAGSLSDVTLREAVATTTTGGDVRIELSNARGTVPVTFDAVTVGAQSSGESTVNPPVPVDFGGKTSVTIPAGGDVYSDPVATPTGGTGELLVSMHIPASSAETSVPVHQTQSASTFYAAGSQTTNMDGSPFTTANSTPGLYYLARVDVSDATATDGTVAVLGDQSAMQAPAGTFGYWAADLPAALTTDSVTLPGSIADVASSGTTITTTNALSYWLRDYVTAEPNLRDVIVSVGANDVLAGQTAQTIEQNLQTLITAIQGYFVDNDPNQPAVQVILTTIVPLNLASASAEEGVREAVNLWITQNDNTAQLSSDIATAVAQPGSPNNVDPSLLSGGVPTTQYYKNIANQIASDISKSIANFGISGL